ncbi:unnamed protein product [Alopecurus aequalis]
MTRNKLHVVESNEEYMVEEPIEQQNCVEQVLTSNVGLEDFGDEDNDTEEGVIGGTKERKRKLKYIWNLPKGKRIVVKCNDIDQPIGVEGKHLGDFLGTIGRNGSLCSLSYKDWRLLIGERDKKTNERINLKAILDQVKMRFLYPARLEKYLLETTRDRWRQHKSDLKAQYFDENKSIEVNYNNGPKCVSPDQWRALVNYWSSQTAKDISAQNKENCGKRKSTHTAGTKSFSRNREELREQDPEKKYPHRAVLYIHTHKPRSKNNKNINAHVAKLKDILEKQPELADTSHGKTAWKGDALNRVLGDDKSGHRTSDPLPTHRDALPVDGNNSKRKRVYCTSPSKQLPMVDEPNNVMIKQSGFHGMSSQPSYKTTAPDKSKQILAQNGDARQGDKNAAAHHTKETDPQHTEKQRVNKVLTTNKSGSRSWLGVGPLAVGTKVFLKSLSSGHKDVALATIVSCDPRYKVDGAEITNQFWAVHVNAVLVKTEELVQKRKNCLSLGNAEGTKIAWPSTFIQKING